MKPLAEKFAGLNELNQLNPLAKKFDDLNVAFGKETLLILM